MVPVRVLRDGRIEYCHCREQCTRSHHPTVQAPGSNIWEASTRTVKIAFVLLQSRSEAVPCCSTCGCRLGYRYCTCTRIAVALNRLKPDCHDCVTSRWWPELV